MSAVELVVTTPNAVGESPVWVAEHDALYWTDIPNRTVHRLAYPSGETTQWTFEEMIGSIAHCGGEQWLLAMETGLFTTKLSKGQKASTSLLAPVNHPSPNMRFNDGRCDRQGRFLASTMFNDMAAAAQIGSLLQLTSANLRTIHDKTLITGNGLAFNAAGDQMYLSDSHPKVQTVWRYHYDQDSGTPHNPELFIDFKALHGRPDGAAIDSDDCYWICANDGSAVMRFTPEGKLDRRIDLPIKKPAMCAYGGAGLDTLFITSIRPGGIDLSDQPLAGSVFAVRPGVSGLAEPPFKM
jgi:sugar lactone lactonase YvrE